MLEFLKVFDRQSQEKVAAENEHVAAVKEELRPFIEAAREKLPALKAAWAARNALYNEINSHSFSNGVPRSAKIYLDNLSTRSDPCAAINAAFEEWQNINYESINDGTGLNRWDVDPNRRAVLIADILTRLQAANCESSIRRDVAAVREKIQEEAERILRDGTSAAPYELPLIPDKPRETIVQTQHRALHY